MRRTPVALPVGRYPTTNLVPLVRYRLPADTFPAERYRAPCSEVPEPPGPLRRVAYPSSGAGGASVRRPMQPFQRAHAPEPA
jgi:hypothetical protein